MKPSSAKFLVRLKPEIHKRLKAESFSRGLSMNQLFEERLLSQSDTSDKTIPGTFGLTVSDLLKVMKQINCEPTAIVLFGSFARGEQHASSDIDLLFVLPPDQKIVRSLYIQWEEAFRSLGKKLSHELSPHFAHIPSEIAQSGSLWLECALNGIVLYEKEAGTVEKFFMRLRHLIAEGRWRRQYAYGQPYWIGEMK